MALTMTIKAHFLVQEHNKMTLTALISAYWSILHEHDNLKSLFEVEGAREHNFKQFQH